jgi:CHAD domain
MAKAKPITGLDAHAPTGKNARIIAKVRLEELYSWEQYVENPYYVRELHDLRIATKRLRYTLEVFVDVLSVACALIIKELEQIQEELGNLHDSDVMIALLRLCLGSQDSGVIYEQALAHANGAKKKVKGAKEAKGTKVLLPPELVRDLVDLSVVPGVEERYGLEQLLHQLQQRREEQYSAFRQHWYQLQARDFRREIVAALDA